MDYQQVSLDTLNNGAARELFEEAWQRLMDNVADENTLATAARSITISIKVKPNKTRDNASTIVSVIEKLAPLNPHEHFVIMSSDGHSLQAYTADPRQAELGLEVPALENTVPFRPVAGER